MADNDGLTEAERAELEQLRAEKAAREEASHQAAERAELERLRAEDDEDLKMPAGQKMVLGVIALVVVVMLLMQFFGGR